MPKQTRTVVLTVVFTLLAVVALQNLTSVPLRIIVWRPTVPLLLLLLLVFLGGALAGWYWRRR